MMIIVIGISKVFIYILNCGTIRVRIVAATIALVALREGVVATTVDKASPTFIVKELGLGALLLLTARLKPNLDGTFQVVQQACNVIVRRKRHFGRRRS